MIRHTRTSLLVSSFFLHIILNECVNVCWECLSIWAPFLASRTFQGCQPPKSGIVVSSIIFCKHIRRLVNTRFFVYNNKQSNIVLFVQISTWLIKIQYGSSLLKLSAYTDGKGNIGNSRSYFNQIGHQLFLNESMLSSTGFLDARL